MTTEPTPSIASEALAFKRSAFRNGWTTFNVRDEHADEAERRLRAIPHAGVIAASDEYTAPIFRARETPSLIEVDLIEKAAVRVGMTSLMNHGAASCVYSEGCNGVSQAHLIAFAREVALHCVSALATEGGA